MSCCIYWAATPLVPLVYFSILLSHLRSTCFSSYLGYAYNNQLPTETFASFDYCNIIVSMALDPPPSSYPLYM